MLWTLVLEPTPIEAIFVLSQRDTKLAPKSCQPMGLLIFESVVFAIAYCFVTWIPPLCFQQAGFDSGGKSIGVGDVYYRTEVESLRCAANPAIVG